MVQLSPILRVSGDGKHLDGKHLMWWCPACRSGHVVPIRSEPHPCWQWNGDASRPTITPSYLEFVPEHKDEDGTVHPRETLCHCIVTNGTIQFCGDSPHALSGKTVPMEPIPANYGGLED